MQPVPNRGQQVAARPLFVIATRLLERILELVGAASDEGGDVLKVLSTLRRHARPGDESPGVERTAYQNLMNQQRQMIPRIAAVRAAGQGGTAPPST